MTAFAGIAFVLALLAALMLGVRVLQSRGRVDAELARKIVHMGMGAVCLGFPWIFTDAAPVWLLAGLAAAALIAIRMVPALCARLGGVLGGVGRRSLGELYFPIAVALVFTLARDDAAAYAGAVGILTFADAAGALVGQRWGRTRFAAVESTKSLEGSAAVFIVTALVVSVALLALSSTPAGKALLVALIMGLFAALVEAVSWRGLDNLLVPLVAVAQLQIYPAMPWPDLVGCGLVMIALALMMLNWRRELLDTAARLGAALAMYLVWSLGDWRWLIAPVFLILSYTRLMPTVPGGPPRHNLAAVVCIGASAVPWAVAHTWAPGWHWLWFYTVALAAQQAIIAAVRFSQGRPRWPRRAWWAVAVAQAVTVQTLGFVLANGFVAIPASHVVLGAGAVAAAVAVFIVWDGDLALPEDMNARWWRQGAMAALASVAGFVLMQP